MLEQYTVKERNEFLKAISRKEAEKGFKKKFEEKMKGGNYESFRRDHETLHELTIELLADVVYKNLIQQLT